MGKFLRISYEVVIKAHLIKIQQNQTLYYGDLPQDDSIMHRRISLVPTMADRIVINMTKSSPTVLLKLDLVGLSNKKAYQANPVLEPKEFLECMF